MGVNGRKTRLPVLLAALALLGLMAAGAVHTQLGNTHTAGEVKAAPAGMATLSVDAAQPPPGLDTQIDVELGQNVLITASGRARYGRGALALLGLLTAGLGAQIMFRL